MSEIYSKHPNGGGKIGRFVTISETVRVEGSAEIRDQCELYGLSIVFAGCILSGYSRMTGNSVVGRSDLSGLVQLHDYAKILDSRLTGDITVTDKAVVEQCDFETATGQQIRIVNSILFGVSCAGAAWVSNAHIRECELLPGVRVYGGNWTRSPKIKRSPFQFDVIESHIVGSLVIGCWTRTLEEWRGIVSVFRRIMGKNGTPSDFFQWDDRKALSGFEKLTPEELAWYADAIENWSTE